MVKSIVAIEDYRFYQHGALDLKGTLRALITNQASGGAVQGGSSITQQMVKMTLLDQAKTAKERKAATADTYARKLTELRYAIAFEQNYSKDWILERYLNIAYYGDGAYGVQAAARHYFGTNAKDLTLLQGATLAGLVKNPTGYDPITNPDRGLQRRNVVLDRLAQLHVISQHKADKLKKQPLGLHPVADAQRLRQLQRAVLLRLRRQLPRARPRARQDGRGPQEAALHRRPDDPHHDQPARPAGGRQLRPRTTSSPRTRRSGRWRWSQPGTGDVKAHRPVAPDGPRRGGRPDLPELRRPAEVRRLRRLPAGLDVQGVRARRRDPAGHPAHADDPVADAR